MSMVSEHEYAFSKKKPEHALEHLEIIKWEKDDGCNLDSPLTVSHMFACPSLALSASF